MSKLSQFPTGLPSNATMDVDFADICACNML